MYGILIFRERAKLIGTMEQIRAKATRDPLALSGALQCGASKLGLPEFKPEQREAIRSALCVRDMFVTLPTGFGKSVIYQALPYCMEALGDDSAPIKPVVLVVSPLIALMRDQVTSLKSKGIKATSLGSHCSAEEQSAIVGGEFSRLFTSPETILQVPEWRKNLLSTGNLIAIAIDEAHFIVKW